MTTEDKIRSTCEAFLETWDRQEWMAEHGEWTEDDEIEEGVIDPDEVEAGAKRLGVECSWQGWDCQEGWIAMRYVDALVLNWWRNPRTDLRRARDLYVVIDLEFFDAEES